MNRCRTSSVSLSVTLLNVTPLMAAHGTRRRPNIDWTISASAVNVTGLASSGAEFGTGSTVRMYRRHDKYGCCYEMNERGQEHAGRVDERKPTRPKTVCRAAAEPV
jgi:hypothetical protein